MSNLIRVFKITLKSLNALLALGYRVLIINRPMRSQAVIKEENESNEPTQPKQAVVHQRRPVEYDSRRMYRRPTRTA